MKPAALSQRDVAALAGLQKMVMEKLSSRETGEKVAMVYHGKGEEKVGK